MLHKANGNGKRKKSETLEGRKGRRERHSEHWKTQNFSKKLIL